jgi:hypothetical protein
VVPPKYRTAPVENHWPIGENEPRGKNNVTVPIGSPTKSSESTGDETKIISVALERAVFVLF